MNQSDPTYDATYSWEFLRSWALDFVIEYMTEGRSSALQMRNGLDHQRLCAGDRDARDALHFLTDVITEAPGAVLDAEHERTYFAECGRAFARLADPKSIVVECSRILLRMEEGTELNALGRCRWRAES
jgi:hypothetical protein